MPFQISILQSKKRTEVLESILGLVKAYSNHFYEGQEYYQDLDVFTQQLSIGMSNFWFKISLLYRVKYKQLRTGLTFC